VLDNLSDLVVKEVSGSGGYGMLVGPASDRARREAFAAKIKSRPGNYVAQPTLALSTVPTMVESGIARRRRDSRHPRRAHARGAQRRIAGGEFQSGRWHQRHLGAGRMSARPC
jgi:uncharacterized circularly permuted ATP-grasp superfamily protein